MSRFEDSVGDARLSQWDRERTAKVGTTSTSSPSKPFGWEVEVEFSKAMIYTPGWQGNWKKSFHYKCSSEAAAKARAMSRPHARAVTRTDPYMTEAEYIRAHGNYWEKGF